MYLCIIVYCIVLYCIVLYIVRILVALRLKGRRIQNVLISRKNLTSELKVVVGSCPVLITPWRRPEMFIWIAQSVKRLVIGPTTERFGSGSPGTVNNFLFIISRPVLGFTQPCNKWVPVTLSPGGKTAGVWSWPLTSSYCQCQGNLDIYIHCAICLHDVELSDAQGQFTGEHANMQTFVQMLSLCFRWVSWGHSWLQVQVFVLLKGNSNIS
jgi:hypothetical protein